jgi:hypothetical protein
VGCRNRLKYIKNVYNIKHDIVHVFFVCSFLKVVKFCKIATIAVATEREDR